jgi:hypothetical protein
MSLPDTDTLDLLYLRAGYSKSRPASYVPKTVAEISPSDGFDLVIVATKHYRVAEAIRQYLPGAPLATFLLWRERLWFDDSPKGQSGGRMTFSELIKQIRSLDRDKTAAQLRNVH